MTTLINRPVLVLNKSWVPIRVTNLENAITTLFRSANGAPKARIIDPVDYTLYTWEDWSKLKPVNEKESIKTVRGLRRIPKVILVESDQMPDQRVKFSRRMLYRRDNNTCQYCGKRLPTEELNVDHVIPRAQGGETKWENLVISCVPCNTKKANRTPEEARMKLRRIPYKPKHSIFKSERRYIDPDWRKFISEMYWEVPLENDEK